ARDFATERELAQFVTAQAELAKHATRTTGKRTAVTTADRTRITRKLLQLQTRSHAVLFGQTRVLDLGDQRGALGSVFRHQLAALFLTIDQSQFRHNSLNS